MEQYKDIKGKMFSITPDGVSPKPIENCDVEESEVLVCKQWLSAFGEQRKTINVGEHSGKLKNLIDKYYRMNVNNGAVIKAMIDLGYDVKIGFSLNAYFNVNLKKWNRFVKLCSKLEL